MSESGKAVFLSYASQDAEAAKRICEALRSGGVEVWFDADGGLEHGDEWDAKIRRQIKECVLFMPIISAETQARHEGYFRIEWDLAAERARGIASGVAFILPVVIDSTREPDALVPDRFRTVQWTKLPGGVVPPDVLQRFLKLWSHRTGALKHAENVGRDRRIPPSETPAGSDDPALQQSRPRWLAPVIGGLAVAVIALLVARPWQPSDSSLPAPRSLPGASAPQSEARQLTAKVWEQLSKPELARAELDVADGFARRATELEPDNADAWAAWSQVNTWYVYHNLDASPRRRQAALDDFTRALQLSPDSYEARLAEACYWVRGLGGHVTDVSPRAAQADHLLRELLREKPDEPRALFALGILQRNTGHLDAAVALFERLARHPAFAAVAWNEAGWAHYLYADFRAAERAIGRSIAVQPYWGNLGLKVMLALGWLGDLSLAEATLERMPASAMQEDYGVSIAVEVSRWRHKPQSILRVLDRLPRDWLQSNGFDGPVALLEGRARQMANQPEAAQRDFHRALDLINDRLKEEPNSVALLGLKANALYELGDGADAGKNYRLIQEIRGTPPGIGLQALLDPAAAIVLLQSDIDRPPRSLAETAASLRLSPVYDPLRTDPRFQAILARAELDPRRSPSAKENLPAGAPTDRPTSKPKP